MKYKCNQPDFNPLGLVDWAKVKDKSVHVSQNGYSYVSGPYPSAKQAEIALSKLAMPITY